jgi:anti-sigma B factor antagonist
MRSAHIAKYTASTPVGWPAGREPTGMRPWPTGRSQAELQGVNVVTSPFSTREEADALVISIDEPASLNDFRSTSFRESLYEAVQTHPGNRVALDLGTVDFLSSSGVAILVGLRRRLDGKQGKLILFNVQPIVQDLLRITRLTQYFNFADDENQALAALRPVPTV